jgi:hypothetical protein
MGSNLRACTLDDLRASSTASTTGPGSAWLGADQRVMEAGLAGRTRQHCDDHANPP